MNTFVFQIENHTSGETLVCDQAWFPFNDLDDFYDVVDVLVPDADQDVYELVTTGMSPLLWSAALIVDSVATWIGETGIDNPANLTVKTITHDGRTLFTVNTKVAVEKLDGELCVSVDNNAMREAALKAAQADQAGDRASVDRELLNFYPEYDAQQAFWADMPMDRLQAVVDVTTVGMTGLAAVLDQQRHA